MQIAPINLKKQMFFFRATPHLIALLVLSIGLKFGGMYGFYINGDGKGYYAYLPATFIYHDLSFNFIKQTDPKYYPNGTITDFRADVDHIPVNKYFVGIAVLYSPFFLFAHCTSLVCGFPADGYAPIYQYAILIAAVFYLWLGLIYLKKLLATFNFSKIQIIWCQILVTFSTPLIFYTIFNPDYTHVYSFTLITIFTYYAKEYIDKRNSSHFILCSIIFGLILLVRPINGMVLFVLPFLAGSIKRFKEALVYAVSKVKPLSVGLLLIGSIASIQCIYYYLETGHWLIWSYSGEGFNFFKPHFIDVLFSYKRGLFIYTPITFLALLGFIKLYRQSIFKAISLSAFLIFVIYGISSWHCWWYGMCFSLRPMTEFMTYFAILLAYSFQLKMSFIIKLIYGLTLVFTVIYNSVQLYQYNTYILHWDNMNKESFWKVFMHTSDEYRGLLWDKKVDIFEAPTAKLSSDTLVFFGFEHSDKKNLTQQIAFSGKYSMLLNKNNHYSSGINALCKEVLNSDSTQFYASAYICPLNYINGKPLHWVLSIENSKGIYEYQSFDMEILPLSINTWYKTGHLFKIGKSKSPTDIVKIYLSNTSNKKICVDDIVIERFH